MSTAICARVTLPRGVVSVCAWRPFAGAAWRIDTTDPAVPTIARTPLDLTEEERATVLARVAPFEPAVLADRAHDATWPADLPRMEVVS